LVCKPKKDGGLGVRDVRAVNLSLLAKWKWRLLNDGEALWKEVLLEKYGRVIGDLLVREDYVWPSYALSGGGI